MNALNTYSQQRDYLISKLQITDPLTLATLERIQDEVDFSHIHKLEVSLNQEMEALELTPNSETIKARVTELKDELNNQLIPVKTVLDTLKREAGEALIRKAKTTELLASAKTKIKALADEITVDANKYNSVALANLATSLKALHI